MGTRDNVKKIAENQSKDQGTGVDQHKSEPVSVMVGRPLGTTATVLGKPKDKRYFLKVMVLLLVAQLKLQRFIFISTNYGISAHSLKSKTNQTKNYYLLSDIYQTQPVAFSYFLTYNCRLQWLTLPHSPERTTILKGPFKNTWFDF